MWLSPLCYKYPRPAVVEPHGGYRDGQSDPVRLFGDKIRPGENYRFWDKYAYGFSEPCRDLLRSDVSARVKKQVRRGLRAHAQRQAQPAPHQDHRLVPDRLPERDLRGRQVHPHAARRARRGQLAAARELLEGLVRPPGLEGRTAVARRSGDLGELRPVLRGARRDRVADPDAGHGGRAPAPRPEPLPRGASTRPSASSRSSTSSGSWSSPKSPGRPISSARSARLPSGAPATGGATTWRPGSRPFWTTCCARTCGSTGTATRERRGEFRKPRRVELSAR